MSQLVPLVFVPAELICGNADTLEPLPALVSPVVEPFIFGTRRDKVLHLHLFEFARAEQKILGVDLVAKGLADLGDSKGKLFSHRRLDIQKVDKDTLGGFGTQIDPAAVLFHGADKSLEHQVEIARFGENFPVAAHWALTGCSLLLAQHVVAEARIAVATIDHRIGETSDVTGGLPNLRVHQNTRIDTLYILPIGHALPPGFLDVSQ